MGSGEVVSKASEAIMAAAWEEAQSMDGAYVGTEHLLLALLRVENSGPRKVLNAVGITPETVRAQIRAMNKGAV
jgi:ATP-dependent Clp protease ATP-binding subunit ClpC